eukprot:m.132241 g.132241  ORF g.132241 m.132241 type:complete len:355 (-) comp23761_c0_seq1:138-1202(-)
MSFASALEIQTVVEDMLKYVWKECLGIELSSPFLRMTFDDAMNQYGSDKPDTRFGLQLQDLTASFAPYATTPINEKHPKGSVYGFSLGEYSKLFSKSEQKKLLESAPEHLRAASQSLDVVQIAEDGSWRCRGHKHIPHSLQQEINDKFETASGHVLLLCSGPQEHFIVPKCAGDARLFIASLIEQKGTILRNPEQINFLWIEDFPLFEWNPDAGKYESSHHCFTAPIPGHETLLATDISKVKGQHFDLVLNGVELGGGSIRNHSHDLQLYIIKDILKERVELFSQLLEALRYGAPPHGGIALGFDRVMMILCKAASLRDVLSFPKSFAGKDLMSQSPGPVSQEDLDRYHIAPTK